MKREKYLLILMLIFVSQVLLFNKLSKEQQSDNIDRQFVRDIEPGRSVVVAAPLGSNSVQKERNLAGEEEEEEEEDDEDDEDDEEEGGGRKSRLESEGRNDSVKIKDVEQRKAESRQLLTRLQNMTHRLFLANMGPPSDSVCQLPDLASPADMCNNKIGWQCSMTPTFTTYNPATRTISVNCSGRFRINQVDRTESSEVMTRGSYRQPAQWKYLEGPTEVAMETHYADVVCKNKRGMDLHNYHTQFLSKPITDSKQLEQFQEVSAREPDWSPVSVLTVILDSTSRAQAHRSCGLPKTMALLRKFSQGYFQSGKKNSHQSFFFNRLNSISGSTVLNLTPLFSGELYENVDFEKVTKGLYAKDINEWIWQYASQRGYLTSYGIDNNSGMMGTRTHCKDCHYRPPVMAHNEHGWKQRENEQVRANILSGFCEGNHMLHEYILNYTRDFLKHSHPAKWAALDLNAGHRPETESGNQVDDELASFLEDVLNDNKELVVFILGDHGKPLHKHPSHPASYYETLLPFLSVVMPTKLLQRRPDIASNLITNQQRYLVHADLHLSMKSLLHFPYMDKVSGAAASKAVNIFTQAVPRQRSCQHANIPSWACVCGYMQKLPEPLWNPTHTNMVHKTLDYINAMHSPAQLRSSAQHPDEDPSPATSCLQLHLKRLLNVLVNENREEALGMARRYVYHVTFQTIEEDTVWAVIMDNDMDIKQVKHISLYQPYDVCWDRRVPLQFCVCDRKSAFKQTTSLTESKRLAR